MLGYRKFSEDLVNALRRGDDVKALAAVCSSVGRQHSEAVLRQWLNAGLPGTLDKHGLTPLMLCVKLKRKYCVRYLLEDAKVDPNVQSAKQETTALILACFYGLADVVRVILGAGAIPGLKNKYASGFCELSSAFLVCTWLWSSVLLVLSCS